MDQRSLDLNFSFNLTSQNETKTFNFPLNSFVEAYESLATDIELKQCSREQVLMEVDFINNLFNNIKNKESFISNQVDWYIPEKVFWVLFEKTNDFNEGLNLEKTKHNILVVRDEGSNGDMEMGAFFKLGGFNVINYNHTMLENDISVLDIADGIVFVGGFTFSDIMGSAMLGNTYKK